MQLSLALLNARESTAADQAYVSRAEACGLCLDRIDGKDGRVRPASGMIGVRNRAVRDVEVVEKGLRGHSHEH